MSRGSRSLLDLPVPCDPAAAARLLARLEARLRAEAAGGLLFSLLSLLAAVAAVAGLPEPLWARLLYAGLLSSASAASAAYHRRRGREAALVADLRSRLERGETPPGLCEAESLAELLRRLLPQARW
jgi:hypothetical protein